MFSPPAAVRHRVWKSLSTRSRSCSMARKKQLRVTVTEAGGRRCLIMGRLKRSAWRRHYTADKTVILPPLRSVLETTGWVVSKMGAPYLARSWGEMWEETKARVEPLRFLLQLLSRRQQGNVSVSNPFPLCHLDRSRPGFPTSQHSPAATNATLRKERRTNSPGYTTLKRKPRGAQRRDLQSCLTAFSRKSTF